MVNLYVCVGECGAGAASSILFSRAYVLDGDSVYFFIIAVGRSVGRSVGRVPDFSGAVKMRNSHSLA